MTSTTHCVGCYNNHYNQPGNSTTGKCWSLPSAKLKTRFQLSINTPMNIREAYVKVRLPDCFRQTGSVFLDSIPNYAQTRKEREAEAKLEQEKAPA